jgi:hypothetical protein
VQFDVRRAGRPILKNVKEEAMFPWFWWQLSPHYEFPLSGNVSQDFVMDRFFNAIKGDAGNGSIEKKAFETASYGKQLGLILDVLLPLTGSKAVSSKEAEKAQKNLENIYKDIYEIRQTMSREKIKEATDTLLNLKRSEPDRFKKEFDRLSD